MQASGGNVAAHSGPMGAHGQGQTTVPSNGSYMIITVNAFEIGVPCVLPRK